MKAAVSHMGKIHSVHLLHDSLVPSFISYPQDLLMNEMEIPKGHSEILQQKLKREMTSYGAHILSSSTLGFLELHWTEPAL